MKDAGSGLLNPLTLEANPMIKAGLCVCVCAVIYTRHPLRCQNQFVWKAEGEWQHPPQCVCECMLLWRWKQGTVTSMLH